MRSISHIDRVIIGWLKRIAIPAARIALFVIFFWFGALKIIGASPAETLVQALFARTLPFISFPAFYMAFAVFECMIGILFLIPNATRTVIALLAIHMIATFLPLILVSSATWQGFLVPTLEGQYIIKNLAIIALAIGIAANLEPLKKS